MNSPILCSACLLGVKCRYDGNSKPNDKVISLLQNETLIPVCPEQLGGLATPRPPSERNGSTVVTKDGQDVTANYVEGANEVLKVAKMYGCAKAILKARSPSCGKGQIYDGTFSGTLTEGNGVCADLLQQNSIEVVTEEEI